MIGPRVGVVVGPRVGPAVGISDYELGAIGFAPVAPGPGSVLIFGQSNALGIGVAASMTDFPAVTASYANFQMTRRGAALNATPTWFSEAQQALQPRTQAFGSFPAGTGGVELQMGRDLDAANGSAWAGILHGLDGSSLEDNWLLATYPTGQAQLMDQLFTEVDAQIIAHGKPLKCAVWIQGEADSQQSPDATDYYANLNTMFTRIRNKYGDIAIVIVRLTNKNTGGQVQEVRTAIESFAMANQRCRVVYSDDLSLRDASHYADDAGGVKGYCNLGQRVAAAVISAVGDSYNTTSPFWGAQGYITVGTSGTALGPVQLPLSYGANNGKNDIGVLWISALGTNPYAAPSGWTEVTNSPQWNNGSSLNARIHVFTRTLQPGDSYPTIADVASDDSKLGGIFIVRNSSGLDVTPQGDAIGAGSTVVTFPGLTTVSNNCLIVHLLAYRTDAATQQVSAPTNGALTDVSEHVDYDTTSGLGFGMFVCTGLKAAAGAIGNTTATLATSVTQARMTLAFRP